MSIIGADIPRVDGLDKLTGRAQYVDDLVMPGMLFGGTVRTPIARGRVKKIHFDPSFDWREFTVVDHRDIEGPNVVSLIEKDWPALVANEFRHKYEPILLIAHESAERLRAGLRAIKVDVEPLPALLDAFAPADSGLIQHGTDNVFKRLEICKGDAAAVMANASRIIEAVYETGAQEHVYLETQGMLAYREGPRLVVQGSMQCPYYVVDSLGYFFGRPRDAFRVVQSAVGGGFGGKEDYPSILAIHAGLLAEKSGRPVKMVYDRQEDMIATTKRHPSRVRHRTAVGADGRLLAMEIEVLLDGGAYVTLSPVVLSRGCIHATGPYSCEHIQVRGEARLSNCPPYGAFRGFGAPQTLFAVERHMDRIAGELKIEPAELRRRNLLRAGQTMATGQVFSDGPDLVKLLDRSLSEAHYEQRRTEHAKSNTAHPYLRRGMGIAMFHHGSGFTGGGETYLASEVWVAGRPDGGVEVQTAQTDMGQGTTTILTQIAAERLGLPEQMVRIAVPDTSRVPNSGPTVASRTAMVVGHLVEAACDDLLRQVAGNGDASRSIREWFVAHTGQALVGRSKYVKPASVQWDDKTYRGDAYAAYSYGAYVAVVEVDLRTYGVRVIDFVAGQEVGRVLNPTLARGQVQGGVVQGIGWAIYEDVVLQDGAMRNAQMTNYIIPASADLPPIRVFFEESPSKFGPGGAKGIGEMPIDGPAPAVINAVCDALGIAVDRIPLTPERLMDALEKK